MSSTSAAGVRSLEFRFPGLSVASVQVNGDAQVGAVGVNVTVLLTFNPVIVITITTSSLLANDPEQLQLVNETLHVQPAWSSEMLAVPPVAPLIDPPIVVTEMDEPELATVYSTAA